MKIFYLFIALLYLASMQCKAQDDKQPQLEEFKVGDTKVQSFKTNWDTIQDSFYNEDTGAFVVDTSIQIWRQDTFDVYRYYSQGEIFRWDRYKKNNLESTTHYKNARCHGSSYSFHDDGKLSDFTLYDDWEIDFSLGVYENGSLKRFAFADTIKKIFYSREYYEGGEIKQIGIGDMVNDTVHDISYWQNGNIMMDSWHNAGKQRMVAYHENGNVMEEYDYIDMTLFLVGEMKWHYEDGTLMHQRFYKDGNTRGEANYSIGTWSWWNEAGKLTRQEKYKNGKLVDEKEFSPVDIKKEKL